MKNTRKPGLAARWWPGGSGRGTLAIVGEPTRLQVVTAHKGSLWLELETHGQAAHGATPHLGRNAIHEMARIVKFWKRIMRRDCAAAAIPCSAWRR